MSRADNRRGAGTRVFKKTSPNGKITTYLGKRDFLDRGTYVDVIDGMVLVDNEFMRERRKVVVQLNAAFRYGREDLDVLGLTFRKDLIKQSFQVFPLEPACQRKLTHLQERLKKKLGDNAFPFWFDIPPFSASSVTLQPAHGDTGKPCGVDYELKTIVAGDNDSLERPRKHSTVRLAIRKLTYSPAVEGPQPMVDVTKEFLMSPGLLHLEASLDKEMYYHGETIAVNVHIQNNSNKSVKKIKISVVQTAEICIFSTASYSCDVDKIESSEGFPVSPGGTLSKTYHMCPLLSKNKDKRGLALNGQLKHEDTNLASTTAQSPNGNAALGILVNYRVKIRLVMSSALSGEIIAELPFTLTHPKPEDDESPSSERRDTITDDDALNHEPGSDLREAKLVDISDVNEINLVQLDESPPEGNMEDLIFEDFARLRVQRNNDNGHVAEIGDHSKRSITPTGNGNGFTGNGNGFS